MSEYIMRFDAFLFLFLPQNKNENKDIKCNFKNTDTVRER